MTEVPPRDARRFYFAIHASIGITLAGTDALAPVLARAQRRARAARGHASVAPQGPLGQPQAALCVDLRDAHHRLAPLRIGKEPAGAEDSGAYPRATAPGGGLALSQSVASGPRAARLYARRGRRG